MNERLGGMTCVVSGSGRGLGRMIARTLAGHRAALVLCARTASEIMQVARELERDFGCSVLARAVDVADPEATARLARAVHDEMGPVHALVNNAGVLGPLGRIDDVDLGEWSSALQTNVAGVANLTAAFAPSMAAAGGGAIVNISGGGIGGPDPPAFMSAYTTSKAGVAMLTETLGAELSPLGIMVNAVAPGPLGTELMRPVLEAGLDVVGPRLHEIARRIYDPAEPATVEVTPELEALLLLLIAERPPWLHGKLLSARWDTVGSLRAAGDELAAGSQLTLRRIDGRLFGALD